jgi:hypothetical protein
MSTSTRGVTRPMGQHDAQDDSAADETPLEQHHRLTLWIPWTILLIGVWLALSPWMLGHLNEALWTVPSGGRGVWFSDDTHDQLRAQLMTWSDIASGVLLAVCAWRMLRPNRPIAWWVACAVGAWLVVAPVVFWSPTAAAFANDTLIGLLVIALTILVPGMPNMVAYMQMGPPRPPGWTYNPSSWDQRWILIALGFVGLVVSRYLAAYQLGYLDAVWDPFFGFDGGTRAVLDSDMSHMWPVSDAGMGAVAYSFEFLMGYMGGISRWRTMPWMVTIFGILVIPLGLAHIALVMSQPVVVHEWCTMCLVAAGVMLPMIPLEADEVVAMGQHVRNSARRGSVPRCGDSPPHRHWSSRPCWESGCWRRRPCSGRASARVQPTWRTSGVPLPPWSPSCRWVRSCGRCAGSTWRSAWVSRPSCGSAPPAWPTPRCSRRPVWRWPCSPCLAVRSGNGMRAGIG